jgi:hypothetical protein
MLTERRRFGRTKVIQPVKVLLADAMHECTVENLNMLGACVTFDATAVAELPSNFDLTFDNCRTLWDCRVIWRNKNVGRVGVSWKMG